MHISGRHPEQRVRVRKLADEIGNYPHTCVRMEETKCFVRMD